MRVSSVDAVLESAVKRVHAFFHSGAKFSRLRLVVRRLRA